MRFSSPVQFHSALNFAPRSGPAWRFVSRHSPQIRQVFCLLLSLTVFLSCRSRSRPSGSGTATFRRPSQAQVQAQANSTAHTRESSQQANSNVYVPPHMNSGFSASAPRSNTVEAKYSKEQLLEIFKAQVSRGLNGHSSEVLTEGWTPGSQNSAGNGGWMRRDDAKEGPGGPDLCWDTTASVKPLGLAPLDNEEQEVC